MEDEELFEALKFSKLQVETFKLSKSKAHIVQYSYKGAFSSPLTSMELFLSENYSCTLYFSFYNETSWNFLEKKLIIDLPEHLCFLASRLLKENFSRLSLRYPKNHKNILDWKSETYKFRLEAEEKYIILGFPDVKNRDFKNSTEVAFYRFHKKLNKWMFDNYKIVSSK